ncbi:putative GNAT family acetyltransferase [Clostridium punense]|uniref:GNAT family acetyltransferase n=1 Tax=Clostridium punense TaxID=1054297 RepID=A0ABS4K7C6_9CLOT|nr:MULTISPECIES: GNAT family N-acetyltransferase [Clostridium]EQB87223.1 hypothetical protein M918_10225 [Clostridium sp. BL8]MBP2023692.1 putative GNAT family acetyltransferase [Clostridium punense]
MRSIAVKEHVFQELIPKEQVIPFTMFYAIGEDKDSFFITNDNNIIIGQQRPTSPLWVYIKNQLSSNEIKEVVNIIGERLVLNPNLMVDGEDRNIKSILEEVSRIFGISFKVNISKNSYVCHNTIKPEKGSGHLSKVNESDLETLTIFSRDNWEDIGFGLLTPEQAIKFAKRKLVKKDFHVWRNEDGKVVAMASVHKHGKIAFTDGVFTDRNERNKGYGKFLVHEITKELLGGGFLPILYADRRQVVPNHIYKSIGYEYCGEITEYRFLSI